jgi:hypothetical protein
MKKSIKYSLLLTAICSLCVLIYGCKNNTSKTLLGESVKDNKTQVKKGLYACEKNGEPAWSWIKIDDDNKFIFHRGPGLSYRPKGEYEVDGNKLYLKTDDLDTYEFKIEKNKLIYVKSDDETLGSDELTFLYTTKSLEDLQKTK